MDNDGEGLSLLGIGLKRPQSLRGEQRYSLFEQVLGERFPSTDEMHFERQVWDDGPRLFCSQDLQLMGFSRAQASGVTEAQPVR